jgi:hypothetical protein
VFHCLFALSGGLVAVLGPVVEVFRLLVLDAGRDFVVGRGVGAEFVGGEHPRHRAGLLHQPAEEVPGCGLVPAVLRENVQEVAVLVDRPPQVLLRAVVFDEDLVQMRFAPASGLSAAQRACVVCPNLARRWRMVS